MGQLLERIRNDPDNAKLFEIQIHRNFAMAVSVLALTLVAVPLGIRVGRKETLANLGVALALALSYYLLVTLASWLAEASESASALVLWLPNLLYLGMGLALMRRANRT